MGQQEYNAFKERMKQWMLDNADIYDQFKELMNTQSDRGYQDIMAQAMALIPKYGMAISKKINSNSVYDTIDIEELVAKEDLGAKLVAQFETVGKQPLVPAMICWLFFGRSFENMLERGEEMQNNKNVSRLQKFFFAYTIKLIIKQSIRMNLRTHEDWQEYNTLKKSIDSNQVVEWAVGSLKEQQAESTPLHYPQKISNLESMILLDSEKKKMLLDKIGEYINTGVKGKRIALMILALRGLGYLPETTSDRQLFTAIKTHFNTYIGSDKSIYAYLESGVTKQFQSEIEALTSCFRVD